MKAKKSEVFLGPDGLPAPRFPTVKGRLPPQLVRCPGCGQHIYGTEKTCPHCAGKLKQLFQKQALAVRKAERALARLSAIFDVGE